MMLAARAWRFVSMSAAFAWTSFSTNGCQPASCPSGTVESGGRCVHFQSQDALATGQSSAADGTAGAQSVAGSTASDSSSAGAAPTGPGNGGASAGAGAANGMAASPSGNPAAAGGSSITGTCPAGLVSQPEACDGSDNDCDGLVDEALTQPCGSAVGTCQTGMTNCEDGRWSAVCEGGIAPAEETCDAERLDEDCDGIANEGCTCTPGETSNCGADMGNCVPGTQTCDNNGAWGSECVGAHDPEPIDSCDAVGQDDDCDGKTDEGCECFGTEQKDCEAGKGVCAVGKASCADGRWGDCNAQTPPRAETCDGAKLDEDCDGSVDENCECNSGETEECPGSERGECRRGTRRCEMGRWSDCTGGVAPKASEICDNKDEDCDGTIDDGSTCSQGMTCSNGRCVECTSSSQCESNDPCRTAQCDTSRNVCTTSPAPRSTSCGGSRVCNGSGTCVDCVEDSDCPDAKMGCSSRSTCERRPGMESLQVSSTRFRLTLNAGYSLLAEVSMNGEGDNPVTISVGGQSATINKFSPTFSFNSATMARTVTITSKEHHEAATCDRLASLDSSGSTAKIYLEDIQGAGADCRDPVVTLTAR